MKKYRPKRKKKPKCLRFESSGEPFRRKILPNLSILFSPHLSLSLLLSLLPLSSPAQSYIHNDLIEQAHRAILSLQFERADSLLQAEQRAHPDNLLPLYFKNYMDCLSLFIFEDEARYQQIKGRKYQRLRQLMKGAEDSPWHLFLQAEVRLHWAVARLKFGDYLEAFNEVSRAEALLSQNERRFPDFSPNRRSLALLRIVVGTIPPSFRWGAQLLGGLEGDMPGGLDDLRRLLKDTTSAPLPFREETLLMYLQCLHSLAERPEEAWGLAHSEGLEAQAGPLHAYLLASLARRTGRPGEVLTILEQRPGQHSQHPLPQLDLLHGEALLHRLEPGADSLLLAFLLQFKGTHYVKYTYLKLAWSQLLQGRPGAYHHYRKRCLAAGAATSDDDRHAQALATSEVLPNLPLLRARLLFDGGYYEQAWLELEEINPDILSADDRLQYHYRRARILHRQGEEKAAIKAYRKVIEEGKKSPWHYACNSALQLGLIYEKSGQTYEARTFFEQCLEMKPEHYRRSIHQKALAGVARVKR